MLSFKYLIIDLLISILHFPLIKEKVGKNKERKGKAFIKISVLYISFLLGLQNGSILLPCFKDISGNNCKLFKLSIVGSNHGFINSNNELRQFLLVLWNVSFLLEIVLFFIKKNTFSRKETFYFPHKKKTKILTQAIWFSKFPFMMVGFFLASVKWFGARLDSFIVHVEE